MDIRSPEIGDAGYAERCWGMLGLTNKNRKMRKNAEIRNRKQKPARIQTVIGIQDDLIGIRVDDII
jgi:hypothetical protein